MLRLTALPPPSSSVRHGGGGGRGRRAMRILKLFACLSRHERSSLASSTSQMGKELHDNMFGHAWTRSSLVAVCITATFFVAVQADCDNAPTTCYVDTPSRILGKTNVNSGFDALTLEYCAQLCHNDNKEFAGAENGNECYCAHKLAPNAKKADPSECNSACTADSSEKCGGEWRISVFNVSCHGKKPVPPPQSQPELLNPCLDKTKGFHNMPFCDPTLGLDERVDDAVSRMTLQEKIASMATDGAPIDSLGIPAYNWWLEATHGLDRMRYNEKTPYATNFAMPITTAMSFNRTMWLKTGRHIGTEARAFMNAGNAWSTFWAPVINLAREPRWGRNLETPGEDPYLTGEYATYFVKGMEQSPEDPRHIQASACCKHYVANSMDGSNEDGVHHDRNHFDATVTMQDLVDSYMAPFQVCVERGRVSGLMCSYNAVNGVPSCANDWLLTEVARNQWGFDGYITSDCDADADVYYSHNYTNTPEEAVRDVLRAGTDVDCGGFVAKFAQSALDKGVITEADLDARLKKLFRVRMRLSHFDPAGPLNNIPASVICSDYAKELSYDGTAQGSTLLKNTDATLPLDKTALNSVAVIGPNSNYSMSIAGYYGPSRPCGLNFWNAVDAVQNFVPKTVSALGVPNVSSIDLSGIPAAVEMAKHVDQVIMAVGTDLTFAAEGHDAINISVPYGQRKLIEAVAEAALKPIVILQLTSVPLDISSWLSNPKIGAIVHLGQPSVTILGVGDILFGNKAPAGRLIQTIYPESYANEISIFDFNMRPGSSDFPRPDCPKKDWGRDCKNGTNPGRTHRFYTGEAVLPFGFGLSYTTFKYSIANVKPGAKKLSLDPVRNILSNTKGAFISLTEMDATAPLVEYSINVTNTGTVDSDDVVLGFLTPPGAGKNGVPLQTLFAFERVHVKVGETVSVLLYPQLTDFTFTQEDGSKAVLPGEYGVRFGVREAFDQGMGFTETVLHTI